MAKYTLKYKLHNGQSPWYVEEPRFKIDGWDYGISRDDEHCYIPSDIQKVSKAELKLVLNAKDFRINGKNLTKVEKEAYIDESFP